jgi:hypothetical protein
MTYLQYLGIFKGICTSTLHKLSYHFPWTMVTFEVLDLGKFLCKYNSQTVLFSPIGNTDTTANAHNASLSKLLKNVNEHSVQKAVLVVQPSCCFALVHPSSGFSPGITWWAARSGRRGRKYNTYLNPLILSVVAVNFY